MNKCSVYIGSNDTQYEGQYEFVDDFLEVEVFHYHAPCDDCVKRWLRCGGGAGGGAKHTLPGCPGPRRFFFRAVREINRGFPNLLGYGSEQDEGPGEDEGDTGEDSGSADDFATRWGWIANVDRASELLRCPWSEV